MRLAFHLRKTLRSSWLRSLLGLSLFIGIFQSSLSLANEEPDLEQLAREHKVYVEPDNISTSEINGEYLLIPYLERRPKWGKTLSFGYNSYEPVNYEPNFSTKDYSTVYAVPTTPLLELQFVVKRNLSVGSFGGEISVGTFENSHSDPAIVQSTLSLTPLRMGVVYSLDTLGREPIWVPYLSAGAYTMIYKESLGGNAVRGNSLVAPYVNAGLGIGLDWIDRHAARIAYHDSGIECTFLYLDVRKYFASTSPNDPDFSSGLDWGAGLRVEF